MINLANDDLNWIANYGWKLLPHTFAQKLLGNRWVTYDHVRFWSHLITTEIAKGNARIILEAPPRHGKSQFMSKVVPAWFLEMYPDKNVILASYSAEIASMFGRSVRNIVEQNKEHLSIRLAQDSQAAHRWNTNLGGGMTTAGVGGSLTGKGGDLMIIDDPVKNWEEATSALRRRKVMDWYESTFSTRAEPGASVIILMTRWHEDDLAGSLLNHEEKENWLHISLPAIAEENDPLGRNMGDALCPERYNEDALEKKRKTVGPLVWNALYQQRPSALEGGIIKRKYFKFYKLLPAKIDDMIMSWDAAFGDTPGSSFVVGQVWARSDANFYLVDQIRDRMDFPTTIEAFKQLHAKHPKAFSKLIEAKANGPAIISSIKNQISGIISISPEGSKESRLSAVSPYFEAGNVHLPDPSIAPWVKDYVEELVNFPNAPNNDQVDATSQALIRFKLQGQGEFKKEHAKKSASKLVRNEDYD